MKTQIELQIQLKVQMGTQLKALTEWKIMEAQPCQTHKSVRF